MKFRVANTGVNLIQKFSYDLALKLDFGSRDPFTDHSAFHDRLSGVIDGNAGLFGNGDSDYYNSVLNGYSTPASVYWIYHFGKLWMGNRPILETDWGPDPDVYQENAFGFVADLFFDPDGSVFVEAYTVAFRDRLFNDQSYGGDQIRITNLNVAVAAPVPEPAAWAMMIAGFGLAGAAFRRRAVSVGYA